VYFCRTMLCINAAYAVMRCLSVSICLAVCHFRLLCQNEWLYRQHFFTFFISHLTAILRRGPLNRGKNCDFRPPSRFWNRWLAECRQQFRPRSRPNLKHKASTSVYCANRHVSVTLVYDSKTRRVCWREQNSFYRASAHWRATLIDKSCPCVRPSVAYYVQEVRYRKQVARQLRTQFVEGISVTLKFTLSHSRSLETEPLADHTRLTIRRSYWTLNIIVTFNVGQRSLKVIEISAIRKLGCGFLFAFYSNYGRICSRLWDIQCQRMAWPWKPG